MIISPRLLIIALISLLLAVSLFQFAMRGKVRPSSVSTSFALSADKAGYKSIPKEIQIMEGSGNQLLLQLDMRYYKRAFFEMQTLADKSLNGWCVHIGDSPSNNGFGGDAGQFSHNAELQILGENGGMLVFGSETPNDQGELKTEMLVGQPALLTQKSALTLDISDGKLVWDGGKKKKGEKISPQLFEINGQPDLKHGGANDMNIFAAFNRSISNPEAGANCISAVKVTLLKQ